MLITIYHHIWRGLISMNYKKDQRVYNSSKVTIKSNHDFHLTMSQINYNNQEKWKLLLVIKLRLRILKLQAENKESMI